jgi:hypothetical protein
VMDAISDDINMARLAQSVRASDFYGSDKHRNLKAASSTLAVGCIFFFLVACYRLLHVFTRCLGQEK